MKQKIYVVTQEWESVDGTREWQILGVSFDLTTAQKIMQEEHNEILSNWPITLKELKDSNDYNLEDTSTHFLLYQEYSCEYDELNIVEKTIE